jgi:transposase
MEGKIQTRQVFDLSKNTVNVTEYRTHEIVCPICNKVHITEFPKTISQPVQYGENLQALMVYLSNCQLIPFDRTTELIGALTGRKISQDTIINVTKKLYKKLE